MFSATQQKCESVPSWGIRIDDMQTDLREGARRTCKIEEMSYATVYNYKGRPVFNYIFVFQKQLFSEFSKCNISVAQLREMSTGSGSSVSNLIIIIDLRH
jgi:hypothetical protein